MNKELDCGLIGLCQDIHFGNSTGSFEALINLNTLNNLNVETNFSFLKQIFEF